jgi:hypothetical protein
MAGQNKLDLQKVLRLAVAQARLALDESNTALNELSNDFLAMAAEIDSLASLIDKSANLPADLRPTLEEAINAFRIKTQQGTVSFQFYDKFSQRMNHLITTLGEMDELVEQGGIEDPAQWQALKESVRKRYTMEQEHRMLDAIEAGATVDEAVAASAPSREDDIELF